MPTIVARLILLASLSAGLGILGCAKFRSSQPELHTIQAAKRADAAAAQKLIDSGLKHLRKGKLDKAEADFLSAIALNSRSGPAHNNLGKVYVLLESHYLAATEFDQAADLMPTRFEPRVNLATLFEDLRRFDEAEEQIAMADTLVPGHPLVISVWARIRAKQELWDGQTEMLLQEVLYRDDRSDWKNWAALLLSQNSFTHDDVLLLNAETAPTFDLRMIPPEELGNPPRVEPMQGDFESQGDGGLPVPLESLPLELSPARRHLRDDGQSAQESTRLDLSNINLSEQPRDEMSSPVLQAAFLQPKTDFSDSVEEPRLQTSADSKPPWVN